MMWSYCQVSWCLLVYWSQAWSWVLASSLQSKLPRSSVHPLCSRGVWLAYPPPTLNPLPRPPAPLQTPPPLILPTLHGANRRRNFTRLVSPRQNHPAFSSLLYYDLHEGSFRKKEPVAVALDPSVIVSPQRSSDANFQQWFTTCSGCDFPCHHHRHPPAMTSAWREWRHKWPLARPKGVCKQRLSPWSQRRWTLARFPEQSIQRERSLCRQWRPRSWSEGTRPIPRLASRYD